MSTAPTPPAAPLELRDDRPAPPGFPGTPGPDEALLVAFRADQPVGAALLRWRGPVAAIRELWVAPEVRGQGIGAALLDGLRDRVRDAGATTATLAVPADETAALALARGHRLLGEYMARPLGDEAALPERSGWRSMSPAEFEPWLEAHVQSYAESNLARSGGDHGLALARSREEFARFLPDGLETADAAVLVLSWDGQRIGDLWLQHRLPGEETFVFDLEILPDRRREGHGRWAMVLIEQLARQAGDRQVGLHVFGDNAAARRLYASQGFDTRIATFDVLAPPA
jgi:ribosomal protein S18 acetylase RimI-like enzyme